MARLPPVWGIVAPILFTVVLGYAQRVPAAVRTVRKLGLYVYGLTHMLVSAERRYHKAPDSGAMASARRRKRVIFIRHGESTWNETFNRGFGPLFPVRVARALLREVWLFLLTKPYSVFMDAPLSSRGTDQGLELRKFLATNTAAGLSAQGRQDMDVLLGRSASSSVLVVSNLRRAIETIVLGLWARLMTTGEKIVILPDLQEMSRNVDTVALTGAGEAPSLGDGANKLSSMLDREQLRGFFDVRRNTGSKRLGRKGDKSMRDFATFIFETPENTIVACGHSLWFKAFFQMFIARSAEHIAKKKKLVNAGVVAFTLEQGEPGEFHIPVDSIEPIFGGFEGEKKKKK